MQFTILTDENGTKTSELLNVDEVLAKHNYAITVADVNKEILPITINQQSNRKVKIISYEN